MSSSHAYSYGKRIESAVFQEDEFIKNLFLHFLKAFESTPFKRNISLPLTFSYFRRPCDIESKIDLT